jgi:signal transduction histidine kinase
MRISGKVALVGGIPITIAAAIALVAWLLLNESERARNGAVIAGTIYRDLLVAMAVRNDYISALSADRAIQQKRFFDLANQARHNLQALAQLARDPAPREATAATQTALTRYIDRMQALVTVTGRNDALITDMAERAGSLIALTDQARQRQRASNADIVAALTAGDRKLRTSRDIVDRAYELRTALFEIAIHDAILRDNSANADTRDAARRRLAFSAAQSRSAATELLAALRAGGQQGDAEQLGALAQSVETELAERVRAARHADNPAAGTAAARNDAAEKLAEWADQLLKVNVTAQRSLHDEVAQLLTYSVQANETEQSTQNIAIATLKLGQRTRDALANREPAEAEPLIAESSKLAITVASLPISPLIQAEMIEAIELWRKALVTTIAGLRQQNATIADMNTDSMIMIEGARSLNDLFASDARTIGDTIRRILIFGAAIGLLLGAGTAILVARSITRPLSRLQHGMVELAANPTAGMLPDSDRNDELGEMARAANFFVTEIGRREHALRRAKDQADAALADLRLAQTNLIQAEKLASLGQLVAGVAHEINTPLGIALTTATAMGDEVKRLADAAAAGQLPRTAFERFIERMRDGAHLLFTNLTRAAGLVHSFKQVAADQASGERRRFDVKIWLDDLLRSLGPALRRTGHHVAVDCPADMVIDTYPGALGQVVTNLMMNALTHAYREGQAGTLSLQVAKPRPDLVRLTFADDGKGISADNLRRVFDPFFTTGRSRGNTGLGLHIVYNLVTSRLHGKIDVESELGKGTRFTIEIPMTAPENPPELLLSAVS